MVAINEGTFVVEVDAVATVSAPSSLSLIRRIQALSLAIIGVSGPALVTARRRFAASSTIAINGSVALARRVVAIVGAGVTINGTVRATRRVTTSLKTSVSITPRARLSWRFIRRAEMRRILRVAPASTMFVPTDRRKFVVVSDRYRMFVPKDREVMP